MSKPVFGGAAADSLTQTLERAAAEASAVKEAGQDGEVVLQITAVEKDGVTRVMSSPVPNHAEPNLYITIAEGLIGEAMKKLRAKWMARAGWEEEMFAYSAWQRVDQWMPALPTLDVDVELHPHTSAVRVSCSRIVMSNIRAAFAAAAAAERAKNG